MAGLAAFLWGLLLHALHRTHLTLGWKNYATCFNWYFLIFLKMIRMIPLSQWSCLQSSAIFGWVFLLIASPFLSWSCCRSSATAGSQSSSVSSLPWLSCIKNFRIPHDMVLNNWLVINKSKNNMRTTWLSRHSQKTQVKSSFQPRSRWFFDLDMESV